MTSDQGVPVWFRYRAGVVAEAERLVHVSGLPIGGSYLIAPCGQWFDRCDTEEVPDPRGPSRAGTGLEPCAVCVMHVLLGAAEIQDQRGRASAINEEQG